MAPYLFLLTVDILGQMLQHPDCGVHGLKLPDNTSITNQMFVDDTLLLLDGTKDNMDRALTVIARFGAASGAKLNVYGSPPRNRHGNGGRQPASNGSSREKSRAIWATLSASASPSMKRTTKCSHSCANTCSNGRTRNYH